MTSNSLATPACRSRLSTLTSCSTVRLSAGVCSLERSIVFIAARCLVRSETTSDTDPKAPLPRARSRRYRLLASHAGLALPE